MTLSVDQISDNSGNIMQQVVQVVNVMDGAVATGTTTMPNDDTIPQNTEGDEYMTLAITPKSVSNILLVEVVTNTGSAIAANTFGVALFQDSTAGALASVAQVRAASEYKMVTNLTHYLISGTTSTTTFKVRIGDAGAGTTTFNGSNSARQQGGVMASSITITEYKPSS